MASTSPSEPVFVLVGHCSPDAGMLRSAVRHVFPGATLVSVNNVAGLTEYRKRGTVWLVNRVLDGDFGGYDGMAILTKAASGDDAPAVMLISNYDDAQATAMVQGALRGFGKLSLYSESTAQAIRTAAERALSATA